MEDMVDANDMVDIVMIQQKKENAEEQSKWSLELKNLPEANQKKRKNSHQAKVIEALNNNNTW